MNNKPLPQAIAPPGFEGTLFGFDDQVLAAGVAGVALTKASGEVNESAPALPNATQTIGIGFSAS